MWFEYFTERISGPTVVGALMGSWENTRQPHRNADFANTKPAWANLDIQARLEGAKHVAFAKYAYGAQR